MSTSNARESLRGMLERGPARAASGVLVVGPREMVRDSFSNFKFRRDGAARRKALEELAACHGPDDLYAFAQAHFPTAGASQRINEILPFLEFAAQRNPRTVVEIGTQSCGTTFLLGRALPTVNTVIGIDMHARNRSRLEAFRRPEQDLHQISGSSSSPQVFAQVRDLLRGRSIDLLFIDGDHSFAGAVNDFRMYRKLVTPGGVVVFHDIVADNWLRSGTSSGAWAGEVPVLWSLLRRQYTHHEFVDSWDQEGSGIGVVEHDPAVEPALARDGRIAVGQV